MKRLHARVLVAVLAVAALIAAACGGGGNDNTTKSGNSGTSSGGGSQVNQTQGSGLTIAMVTHSDEGSFWSVVKKGAQQAAQDEGVKLVWSPSNNDPQKEAQLIDAAVSQKVDGLAVSVPNASAIRGALRSPAWRPARSSRPPASRRSSASSTSRTTSACSSAATASSRASAAL
jgi:simple sugar transport system substrate-binding protein